MLALFAGALQLNAATDAKSLPKPTGYVSDLSQCGRFRIGQQQLEEFCTRVEQQLGVQFALVTIDTIGDTPIENSRSISSLTGVSAIRKIIQASCSCWSIRDHKSRVEVGRGVEPYVTDGFAGSTLRSMRPDLRASKLWRGPARRCARNGGRNRPGQRRLIYWG